MSEKNSASLTSEILNRSVGSSKEGDTCFPKSIVIFFKKSCHKFLIYKQQRFFEILQNACKHWRLNSANSELRDEDGCIIPEQASVEQIFGHEISDERIGCDTNEAFSPHVFLCTLDKLNEYNMRENDVFHVDVKSLSSSLSCNLNESLEEDDCEQVTVAFYQKVSVASDVNQSKNLLIHSPSMPVNLSVSENRKNSFGKNKAISKRYILNDRVLAQSSNDLNNSKNFLTSKVDDARDYDSRNSDLDQSLSKNYSGYNTVGISDLARENCTDQTLPGPKTHKRNDRYKCKFEDNTNRINVLDCSFDNSPEVLSVLPSRCNMQTDEMDKPKTGIQLLKGYERVTIDEFQQNRNIQSIPTSVKLTQLVWELTPRVVLLIKKPYDPEVSEMFLKVSSWLVEEKKLQVLVEPLVAKAVPYLKSYLDCNMEIDLVISFGGDGTVLYVNSLFQKLMPPLMAFNTGSLGFLTPFGYQNYKRSINSVLKQCNLMLRSRLYCVVRRFVEETEVVEKYTVLNEVIIERGSSPYLSNLECYCDGYLVTTIQGDGIIISSTTGSTAYSLSAGGSMVHPQVPAILFTPVCPHSLSFRPVLFPDSVELKIKFPYYSRGTRAWVSFDGRFTKELHHGDYIVIKMSKYPFFWISKNDAIVDWFKSLGECLNWNNRIKQKSFCKSFT